MTNRKGTMLLLVIIAIVVFGAVGWIAFQVLSVTSVPPTPYQSAGNVQVQEKEINADDSINPGWRYNRKLSTILLLGINGSAETEFQGVRGKGGLAEHILLLIVDDENCTIKMLEIPGNTLISVDVYDSERVQKGSTELPIQMQYAFGESKSRSNMLMKRKLSKLLNDIPITSCCAVEMDGIAVAIDTVGGITIPAGVDWSEIDPGYQTDQAIELTGADVLRLIQSVYDQNMEDSSVLLEKKEAFLKEVFRALRIKGKAQFETLFSSLDPYLETDMNVELTDKLLAYTLEDAIVIPGNTEIIDDLSVYCIDTEALRALTWDLLYVPVS